MLDPRITNEYENDILELIETQLRNDKDSLTQSDLQAVVAGLVNRIMLASKEL